METQSLDRVAPSPDRERPIRKSLPAEARDAPPADGVFRPEVFFLGRTQGAGVVRDPLGRIIRRCAISTHGEFSPTYGAIHFDETFTFDDGQVDVWRWAMTPGRDGRYVAAEATVGSGIAAETRGLDCHLTFHRRAGRAHSLLAPRYATRFTLLTPDMALKRARVSLLGVPLAILTAVHRRDG